MQTLLTCLFSCQGLLLSTENSRVRQRPWTQVQTEVLTEDAPWQASNVRWNRQLFPLKNSPPPRQTTFSRPGKRLETSWSQVGVPRSNSQAPPNKHSGWHLSLAHKMLSNFILLITLPGECIYHVHFIDEYTETQRKEETCIRSHSWSGFESLTDSHTRPF